MKKLFGSDLFHRWTSIIKFIKTLISVGIDNTVREHIFDLNVLNFKMQKRVHRHDLSMTIFHFFFSCSLRRWIDIFHILLFFRLDVDIYVLVIFLMGGLSYIISNCLTSITVGLLTLVFYFSTDQGQKLLLPLEEIWMREDQFRWLPPWFLESIHIELNVIMCTCLMKLWTFLCLKYLGRIVSWKRSGFLMMNSNPLVSQCIMWWYSGVWVVCKVRRGGERLSGQN